MANETNLVFYFLCRLVYGYTPILDQGQSGVRSLTSPSVQVIHPHYHHSCSIIIATKMSPIADPTTEHVHEKTIQTVLQAISQGMTLPGIPSFTSIDKQRRWILEHMAGAFRVFARKGYTEGMAGHISVRDPEHPGAFWTNPLGRHFGLLKASDMILVNGDGEAIGGNMVCVISTAMEVPWTW